MKFDGVAAAVSAALAGSLWQAAQLTYAAPTGNLDHVEVVTHYLAGREAADVQLTCKVNLGSTRYRYGIAGRALH